MSRRSPKVYTLGDPSVCGDGGPIGRVEDIFCAFSGPREEITWEVAQVRPSVHNVTPFADYVRDKEAVWIGGAEVCRRYWLLAEFLCWGEHGGLHFPASSPKRLWSQQMTWRLGDFQGCCSGVHSSGTICLLVSHTKQPLGARALQTLQQSVLGREGETLAEMRCGATSKILSARCEAESRLPSVWPSSMVFACGGRRLAQMVQRKSSRTFVARPLKCLRNWDGFRSPISSCKRSSSHVLFAWGGQPAHQLCFKPVMGLVVWRRRDDVFYLGGKLLVELWHHVV